MAERLRFMRTSADASGDGTTNTDSSGDNTHAYDSLSAAEAGEQADLVAAGDTLRIVCSVGSGSAADTTRVTFASANWTTAAANYVTMESASGEEATAEWNTANSRMSVSEAFNSILDLQIFSRIRNFQLENTANADQTRGINLDAATPATALDWEIESCHIRHTGTVTTTVASFGIQPFGDFALSIKIWNTFISGFYRGIRSRFNSTVGTTQEIYNLTCVEQGQYCINLDGWNNSNNVCKMRNLNLEAAIGAVADYLSPLSSARVETDILTADTSSPTSDGSKTFTFVSGTDFTNASDSDAVDAGTDLSSDPDLAFSADLNGITITGTWDVGAAQFVSAGGGELLQIPHHLAGGFNPLQGGFAR